MKRPGELENRVQRIYELVDGSDSERIWNDRIQDPDNSIQLRQSM